jgi:hypothetical protein
VQRTGDSHTGRVLGGLMIGRSGTPCAVCTVHVETRSVSFLIEPQNQSRRFVCGLASKPLGRFSPIWPKTGGYGFLCFGLKTCSYGFS